MFIFFPRDAASFNTKALKKREKSWDSVASWSVFCLLAELNPTAEAEAGEVDKIALLTQQKKANKKRECSWEGLLVACFSLMLLQRVRGFHGARLRDWAAGRLRVIQQKRCGGIPGCLYAAADWDDEPQVLMEEEARPGPDVTQPHSVHTLLSNQWFWSFSLSARHWWLVLPQFEVVLVFRDTKKGQWKIMLPAKICSDHPPVV